MAATLWGALDTMVRALGGRGPRSAMVEVDERRILATQIPPNWTLLLVAERSVEDRRLRQEAQRITNQIVSERRNAATRSVPLDARE